MADAGESSLRCACGEGILATDILVTAYEMRSVGPDYLYVKYRCSRCGRMGEHRLEQRPVRRVVEPLPERALSPISLSEVDAFHQALGRPDALSSLAAQLKGPRQGDDDRGTG